MDTSLSPGEIAVGLAPEADSVFPAPAGVGLDGWRTHSCGTRVPHDGAVVGAEEGGVAPRGGESSLYAVGERETWTVTAIGDSVREGIGAA